MSDSIHVLKYVDEAGETTVTLHHSLEDAQLYRALIIANLVSEGIFGNDEVAADVIIDRMLSGEFDLAYEEFIVWCEKSDDYSEIFFDIRESHTLPPTNMYDILEALSLTEDDTSEVKVEVVDLTKPSVPVEKPFSGTTSYVPKKNPLLDRLQEVTKDLSLAASGASIEDSSPPKVRVLSPEDFILMTESGDDDMTDEEVRELLRFQAQGSYDIRPAGNGMYEAVEPKRIDGVHSKKTFFQSLAQGVFGGGEDLTTARQVVKVREQGREYPEVKHRIKKKGG